MTQRDSDKKWYAKNSEKKRAAQKQRRLDPAVRAREKAATAEYIRLGKAAAAMRRYMARKNGYAECTDYPPPPADGRCDICSRVSRLCLDHCHKTGRFRGYICFDCNIGLGKLGDNLDGLRRAIVYLERNYT